MINRLAKLLRRYPNLESIPYWIAAILTALAAVAYTKIFDFITFVSQRISQETPLMFLFILVPAGFAVSTWMILRIAPTASGSGIPQVMATLESNEKDDVQHIKSLLSFRVIVVKVISSLICLLGGGVLGREGPTVQIGASIFRIFGTKFRKVWSEANLHSWILAGAAAGIAAAFNTPLGGVVFAVEELSGPHFSRFKTSIISAVIIAGVASQLFTGPYLYFGYPAINPYTSNILFWVALLSCILGIAGGGMVKAFTFVNKKIFGLSFNRRVGFSIVCGMALGALTLKLGTGMIGGGTDLIKNMLFTDQSHPGWPVALGRYLGLFLTYSVGAAGGIFSPSLSIGGIAGAQLADWMGIAGHQNLFVLTGMAAFLSAVTNAPFTASVLVLEMTDRHSVILPLLVASVCGSVFARLIHSESLYHEQAKNFIKKAQAFV